MEYRYRTNLKKVFLTDSELKQLNNRIAESRSKNFSEYARKVLLNPNMTFLIIDTSNYKELIFYHLSSPSRYLTKNILSSIVKIRKL
ncbi:hypothetical protein ACEE22_07360, partial [Streptococcus suis]